MGQNPESSKPPLSETVTYGTFFTSLFFFLLCLFSPAYQIVGMGTGGTYSGWAAFLMGPIVILGVGSSWLANPLLFVSWRLLLKGKHSEALAVSLVAMLLALSFLLYETVPVGSSGPGRFYVLHGYYMWIVSIALPGVAGLIGVLSERRVRVNQLGRSALDSSDESSNGA